MKNGKLAGRKEEKKRRKEEKKEEEKRRKRRGKKSPGFNRDSRENRNKKHKNRFRTGPRIERV